MKSLVIYYSRSGNTKKHAQALAKKMGAGLMEVRETKPYGELGAYTRGCFAALRGKRVPIDPARTNFTGIDKVIVMGPVWAGRPAPAVNSIFDMIPPGKDVEVKMVSGSGHSKAREKVESLLKGKGMKSVAFEDVKA